MDTNENLAQDAQKQEQPTRDEIIAWYKAQIELASLRLQLADLNSKTAIADAQRLNAVMTMSAMQVSQEEGEQDENITPNEEPASGGGRTLKRSS